MNFPEVPLSLLLIEVFNRNREGLVEDVYSVTNEQGFMPSDEFFSKQVYSRDINNYKIVHPGQFAYNPSRVNVGSIDYLRHTAAVAISPMYVVFEIVEELIIRDYLLYFFKGELGLAWISHMTAGSVRDTLRFDDLARIQIPLPPLPEQARIVAILRQADELRRLRHQALAKIKALRHSYFIEVFGDGIDGANRNRVKLAEACQDENDIKCGPFGTQLTKSEYKETGVPLWSIPHVNSHFRKGTDEFVSRSKAAELDAYSLIPGDVVMTRKGTVGNSAVYPEGMSKGIMHSDLLRIRPDLSRCLPEFLTAQLNYDLLVQHQIEQLSAGAVSSGVSVTKLKQISIFLPSIEEQQQFVEVIKEAEIQQELNKNSQLQLNVLLDSLLNRAFSGELTAVYRAHHQEELQEAAAQRDIALGLRGQEPRLIDFEAGRVTPEEEEQLRQSVQQVFKPAMQDLLTSLGTSNTFETLAQQTNFPILADLIRPALPTYNNLVSDILADSLAAIGEGMRLTLAEHFTDTMAAAIAPLAKSIQLPSETFYQSLSQSILALAAQARQIVKEPPQPTRAIHAQLDPTVKTTLQAIKALSTYFTPTELHQLLQELGHHFGQNRATDLVQVEASLQLLEAAGFVRQVHVSERLVYRLIDPIADGALLPTELAG